MCELLLLVLKTSKNRQTGDLHPRHVYAGFLPLLIKVQGSGDVKTDTVGTLQLWPFTSYKYL